MRKSVFVFILLVVALVVGTVLVYRRQNHDKMEYLAVTGATPLALAETVPAGVDLTVDGRVKQVYHFVGTALRTLATTRLRTREVDPDGNFLGTYAHVGIPVYNILEGVAPAYPPGTPFDRPLDLVVRFTARDGRQTFYSYGELTMTDDHLPVTLAFHRMPVLPSKDPREYTLNRFTEPLTGLRLIAPRDPDTARYLNDVVRMTLLLPRFPEEMLPLVRKGTDCVAESLTCVSAVAMVPARFEEVPLRTVTDWVRVGHGRGFKGIEPAVSGYDMRAFLTLNFPGETEADYFLFVGCDGYRALFSGREIFATTDGEAMLILPGHVREPAAVGYTLAPTADFFVDRDVWGLSHVVHVTAEAVQAGS
ncbi:MAG: hypothetical protein JXQ27_04230 [Acidobacteria bacterium]|nr:hypothetical protein [Acidobacteriota bacterium]